MTYNQDIITIVQQASTNEHFGLGIVLSTLTLLSVILMLAFFAIEEYQGCVVSFVCMLIFLALLIRNYPYSLYYTIAIEPTATFEEVSKDFILVERLKDGTWKAEYIPKYEDYKGDD